MAAFVVSAEALCRAERMGEEMTAGCVAARATRVDEACREMAGWESPRRTRLMAVGE